MSAWEAVLLGIVQGATEFLPVSSSGHLVMGQKLLDVRIPGVAFEVAVHVATLLSVLIVYRGRVAHLIAGILQNDARAWSYFGLLALASVPAGFVGVVFREAAERAFEVPAVTGLALLVTGAVLWSSRWTYLFSRSGVQELDAGIERGAIKPPQQLQVAVSPGLSQRPLISWRAALIVGAAQALAILPGISRSGTTVVAALWCRVRAEDAAEFSFLMAIPAILGAAVLELPKLAEGGGEVGAMALVAGVVAAALTGVAAIRAFLRLLERQRFHRFGVYCWVVGGLFLAYLLAR